MDYMRPDFQANMQLPQWMDMGEEQNTNVSPFVDALKKRMKSKPMGAGIGTETGGGMPYSEMLGGMNASGGGPKSL